MKKILLVKLDDPSDYERYPPFGIMYLANALKSKGYDSIIYHEKFSKKSIKDIKRLARDCLFVGFSVMTAPSIKYDILASKEIKKMNKPVVWGGKHPTILPEITLKDDFIDIICMGEGEETIISIAEYYRGKGKLEEIEGIGYKLNGKIIIRDKSKPVDINKYHAYYGNLNILRYLQRRFNFNKILPYETSRGCPHRCKFCYNLNFNKRIWRGKDTSLIDKELDTLKKYGVHGFYFLDDNFFTNKNRALKILEKLDCPWFAELRADYFSDEFIHKIKNLGCQELFVGAESGSDITLDLINKDISVEQIENAVKLCEKYNIKCTLSFIIGFPHETLTQRKETLEFMYKLHKKYKVVNLDGPKIFAPYPGTPIYEESIRAGFIPPKSSLEWGEKLSRFKCNLPWIDKKDRTRLSLMFLMVQLAQMKPKGNFGLIFSLVKKWEEYRWKNHNLNFIIDLIIINKLKNSKTKQFFFKYLKLR
jgi:radical SAM superfamily enzyme YgiQ (UPF0313 family)